MKRLIFDLDNTISFKDKNYEDAKVNTALVKKMREYKNAGFEIVISTSRNMRTYENNTGKINKHTLPKIIEWLEKNEIEFDEIYVGKVWCGFEGFYIDDRAIRPSEFIDLSYSEILDKLNK